VYTVHDVNGSDFNPCLRAVMTRRAEGDHRPVLTASHDEVVPGRAWERSPWVNDYARPARVTHFLSSLRFLGPAVAQGFGFMRAVGDRPFSEEDRSLLHLISLEGTPLFSPEGDDLPRVSSSELRRVPLPPRAREVLDCLLSELGAAIGGAVHDVAFSLGGR
jgi:hypothetical protein